MRRWAIVACLTLLACVSGEGQSPTPVLTPEDVQYLGSFEISLRSGTNTQYSRGFTLRRVGEDDLHFFTGSWSGNGAKPNHLLEYRVPSTLATAYPYPAATLIRNWGDNWHQGKFAGVVYGLHWDDVDQRLYWITTSEYSGNNERKTITYGEIDPSIPAFVARGSWSFPPQPTSGYDPVNAPGYKWLKGITDIPAPYRARLNGWRMAGGFGGNESVMGVGGVSMGPALIPFNHEALDEENTSLPPTAFRTLLYHDLAHRGRRNPNYRQNMEPAYNPVNGVGTWTWADDVGQSGIWLHTGTKQGFLVFVRQVMGGEATHYTQVETISTWGRRLTLDAPLPNVRVNDLINVPLISSPSRPYTGAIVKEIGDGTLDVTLTLDLNFPDPVMAPEGEIWRGAFYYKAGNASTEGRVALLIYDSEDLLSGRPVHEIDPVSETGIKLPTLPMRLPSWWTGQDPGVIDGVDFDPTTRRLYVLVQNSFPFPVQELKTRTMVHVYELPGVAETRLPPDPTGTPIVEK